MFLSSTMMPPQKMISALRRDLPEVFSSISGNHDNMFFRRYVHCDISLAITSIGSPFPGGATA